MRTVIRRIDFFYNWCVDAVAPYLQSLVLLLFRLQWGLAFFHTGKGKLMNHEGVTGFFESLGIPFPGINAWMVGSFEMIGGLLILLGLGARPAGAVLTGVMLVAYISVEEDRNALFGALSEIDPFVEAAPFFFLLTAVLMLAFGAGLFSIDAIIGRQRRRS